MYLEADGMDKARLALTRLLKFNAKQTNVFLERILERVNDKIFSILESDLTRAIKCSEVKITGLYTRIVMQIVNHLMDTFISWDYETRKDIQRACMLGIQEHFMRKYRRTRVGLILSITRMRQRFREEDRRFIKDASPNEKKLLGMMLLLEVLREEPTNLTQESEERFQMFLRNFKMKLREGGTKRHQYPYKNLLNKTFAKDAFKADISKVSRRLQQRRRSVKILRKTFSVDQLVPEIKLLSMLTADRRCCFFY
ncbi:hypothetical protein Aperf_G00000074863 [Anoplocephala perfoliata]